MIIKNIKTNFSILAITTFLFVFTAPKGMCLPVSSQINAGVTKPALRTNAVPSSLRLEGDISISKKNPKISLSLRDSDVKQVLRMFADKAGLNIIFHSSVDTPPSSNTTNQSGTPPIPTTTTSTTNSINPSSSQLQTTQAPNQPNTSTQKFERKVTLDLVNVPLNDAFRMVMQVTDLTYYIDKNTIVIADATAAQKLNIAKQELMTIPVKYVDAATLADFLNKDVFSINKPGLSNAQIAVTNPRANEILIFGTKNDYLMAQKIVTQFDIKPLDETFTVNHTTPKEMANLLCQVLFNVNNSSSSSSSSSTSTSTSTSSSSSSTSSNDDGDLSIGGGVVACQIGGSSSGTSSSAPVSTSTTSTSASASSGTGTSGVSLSSINNTALLVTYFAQKGTVSVMGGSAEQMNMIRKFIAENDKKQPQAILELSLIELNDDGSQTFNNTWKVWSSFFSGTFDSTGVTTNPIYPNFFGGDYYNVVDSSNPSKDPLYKISKFAGTPTAAYTMNYLIKNTKGRVLANPRIVVTNGRKATVSLQSDYIAKTTPTVSPTSVGATVTTYDYTIGHDNGIQVEITSPYISPDGYVTLSIHPLYATIKEQIPGVGANNAPIVAATLLTHRELNLKNIRIKDGETFVIGGMIQETEIKDVQKVPVLGDLPGVGMFFRNTSSKKAKEELVIMITPKIVKDSEDVVSKPNMAL